MSDYNDPRYTTCIYCSCRPCSPHCKQQTYPMLSRVKVPRRQVTQEQRLSERVRDARVGPVGPGKLREEPGKSRSPVRSDD